MICNNAGNILLYWAVFLFIPMAIVLHLQTSKLNNLMSTHGIKKSYFKKREQPLPLEIQEQVKKLKKVAMIVVLAAVSWFAFLIYLDHNCPK